MSKRYFINNLDSVIGQAIYRELVKEEMEEPVHMVTFLDLERKDKPNGIKKILKRDKPKLSRKKMLEECDVYIYDVHFGELSDVEFGVSIFKDTPIEEQKTFILISDVMGWNATEKKVKPYKPKSKKKMNEDGMEEDEVEGEEDLENFDEKDEE